MDTIPLHNLSNIYNKVEIRDWVNCNDSNDNDNGMINNTQLLSENVNVESIDCLSYNNVFHKFSEHTWHTGRSDQDRGTGHMASCQISFQGSHEYPSWDPSANHDGDGTYNSVTNMINPITSVSDGWQVDYMRPSHYINQGQSNTDDAVRHIGKVSIYFDYFMVHFTNWQYYHNITNSIVCIVYIDNFECQNSSKPYYFCIDNQQNATVFHCHDVPQGFLAIVSSSWWGITRNIANTHWQQTATNVNTGTDPLVAYENFQKDCVVNKFFHMTYDRYMECIIDAIISYQEKRIDGLYMNGSNGMLESQKQNILKQKDSEVVCTGYKVSLTKTNNTSVDCSLSLDLKALLHANTEQIHSGRDIYLPNKSHGHLTFKAEHFEFIGPDRKPMEVNNIHEYLKIAQAIKSTGVPNYKLARIPIKSDLNLDAWEYHLQDYPDKRVLQYLKFGFPLSLKNSDQLSNTEVINHYSALQYPDHVQQYIDKEMNLGAMLGPLDQPPSDHFHCSPLLTRPKDKIDRRIILNLSYPQGKSVNDFVDKESFDGSKFALKLPTIDDIVSEIENLGNEALLAKIDVARAFRNLRVDPADALKFGISMG